MKLTQILTGAAAAGTIVLTAGSVSAIPSIPTFPLGVKSISGRLTTTTYYGSSAATTTNKYTVKSFNLKEVMYLITNTVAASTNVPNDVHLTYDPYASDLYLTNHLGFYYSLSAHGIGYLDLYADATKFKGATDSGEAENDVILAELNLYGLFDQNGKFYQIGIFGSGTLSVSRNKDGIATMILSVQGGDAYGEYQDSDSGVCTGSWSFKGTGFLPADGMPFSVWWFNHRII